MRLQGGRADSAPTLDSIMKVWYSSDGGVDNPQRKVTFSDLIEFRAIPTSGRCRPTPARGSTRSRTTRWRTAAGNAKAHGSMVKDLDECQEMEVHENQGRDDQQEQLDSAERKPGCECGTMNSQSWSTFEDNAVCQSCARSWASLPRTLRKIDSIEMELTPDIADRGDWIAEGHDEEANDNLIIDSEKSQQDHGRGDDPSADIGGDNAGAHFCFYVQYFRGDAGVSGRGEIAQVVRVRGNGYQAGTSIEARPVPTLSIAPNSCGMHLGMSNLLPAALVAGGALNVCTPAHVFGHMCVCICSCVHACACVQLFFCLGWADMACWGSAPMSAQVFTSDDLTNWREAARERTLAFLLLT